LQNGTPHSIPLIDSSCELGTKGNIHLLEVIDTYATKALGPADLFPVNMIELEGFTHAFLEKRALGILKGLGHLTRDVKK
jgi:hypothetical protein